MRNRFLLTIRNRLSTARWAAGSRSTSTNHVQQRIRPSGAIQFRPTFHDKPEPLVEASRLRVLLVHIQPQLALVECLRVCNQEATAAVAAAVWIEEQSFDAVFGAEHEADGHVCGAGEDPNLELVDAERLREKRAVGIDIASGEKIVSRAYGPLPDGDDRGVVVRTRGANGPVLRQARF